MTELKNSYPYEGYWPNGNLQSRLNYKDGKRHDLSEYWYKDGNLWSRENYKNGKRHGLCESWYRDGTLIFKEYYFDDKEITEFEYDVLKTCGGFENE